MPGWRPSVIGGSGPPPSPGAHAQLRAAALLTCSGLPGSSAAAPAQQHGKLTTGCWSGKGVPEAALATSWRMRMAAVRRHAATSTGTILSQRSLPHMKAAVWQAFRHTGICPVLSLEETPSHESDGLVSSYGHHSGITGRWEIYPVWVMDNFSAIPAAPLPSGGCLRADPLGWHGLPAAASEALLIRRTAVTAMQHERLPKLPPRETMHISQQLAGSCLLHLSAAFTPPQSDCSLPHKCSMQSTARAGARHAARRLRRTGEAAMHIA